MTAVRARPPWPGPFPRVERDEDNDHPLFFHECTGERARRTILPLGSAGWQWQADGSLVPSIHCLECNTHGWWRPEGWVSA